MITKMKKMTFLLTNSEYNSFIDNIRNIGVMHVEELQTGASSPEFEMAKELDKRIDNVLTVLDFAEESYETDKEYKPVDITTVHDVKNAAKKLVEDVETLGEKELSVKHDIDELEKNIAKVEPWGEFDKDKLNELAIAGFIPHFWTCPKKLFKKEWVDEYFATVINDENGKFYFITFAKEKPDITAELIDLPNARLSELKDSKKLLEAKLKDIQEEYLKINKQSRNVIMAGKVENENDMSLSKVHLNSESVAEDQLKLMVGWIPNEKQDEVTDYLEQNKIFYEMEDPNLEDDVPVEIKNDKYSSLFEPILKMYSLPKYSDLDITPYFAPFFMLFFGLCLGDAGYGLIVLAASIYLFFKSSEKVKPYAKLGIYLGATTVVCGLLTGTFLGIDLREQEWAFLAPVRDLFINEKNYKIFGYPPMMVISVIIGLIQVLFGMVLAGMKAAKVFGWKFAIGKISWVLGIITAIITFGLPAAGVEMPKPLMYVLYAVLAICLIGIFFLNSPGKNVFVNFGAGVWETYGMATGLLGDLLSYIRLFALGLTGGVLGSVFNSLAYDLTDSMSWTIRWLPMLLILLAGHGINFGLCMISSFVHPMRLTFVEFFKNANFEGGGKEYKPFKINTYQVEK